MIVEVSIILAWVDYWTAHLLGPLLFPSALANFSLQEVKSAKTQINFWCEMPRQQCQYVRTSHSWCLQDFSVGHSVADFSHPASLWFRERCTLWVDTTIYSNSVFTFARVDFLSESFVVQLKKNNITVYITGRKEEDATGLLIAVPCSGGFPVPTGPVACARSSPERLPLAWCRLCLWRHVQLSPVQLICSSQRVQRYHCRGGSLPRTLFKKRRQVWRSQFYCACAPHGSWHVRLVIKCTAVKQYHN